MSGRAVWGKHGGSGDRQESRESFHAAAGKRHEHNFCKRSPPQVVSIAINLALPIVFFMIGEPRGGWQALNGRAGASTVAGGWRLQLEDPWLA